MIDFEQAVMCSFKKNWSQAQVKGCLFHFSQSLFKNLAKHHLKEVYLVDEELVDDCIYWLYLVEWV